MTIRATLRLVFAFLLLPLAAAAQKSPPAPLQAVPATQVRLVSGFWAERLETNRKVTIPVALNECERSGRIRNFAVAGGLEEGDFEGIFFNDSDVFKLIEGASYSLAQHPDPKLEERIDGIIAKIAAAQEDDGYLYSYRTIKKEAAEGGAGPKRWSNLRFSHELYNVGHLYEAAVAHHAATGKRTLLDVALKNAELIYRVFGPGADQRKDPPGHQEIELGLLDLHRATGDERWSKLAHWFLEARGRDEGRQLYGPYSQDHRPVSEQREATGHAVRAGYLYAAMAEWAARSGQSDYDAALDALWEDVTARKLYLTGGIGARRHGEAFGDAYELPNDTAYAETCAAIALGLWSQRMFLRGRDAASIDVLERALYNGFLSGVSLEGETFFYPNPLACDGHRGFNQGAKTRKRWFNCSCCPVNVVRFIPSIPGMIYASDGRDLWVNLYAANEAKLELSGTKLTLRQEGDYPWGGRVALVVNPERELEFGLRLRIPGWSRDASCPGGLYTAWSELNPAWWSVSVNGREQRVGLEKGYAVLRRKWKPGDRVTLSLDMRVRRMLSDERLSSNQGRMALERGPLVYCFEAVDNGGRVHDLVLEKDGPFQTEFAPELPGAPVALRVAARRARGEASESSETVSARAIPYALWSHRGPGEMAVWMPLDPKLAKPRPERPLAGVARASASHTWSSDQIAALNDGFVPKSSGDHELPRHTFWPRKGSREWIQYDFPDGMTLQGIELYWFDDREVGGGCRVPASWRLLARREKDGEWKPVELKQKATVRRDRWNKVEFAARKVRGLRVEVELEKEHSAGILEWRILPQEKKAKPAWKPAGKTLMTRWGKALDPEQVHQEYPRPRLVRDEWRNLNGLWDYAIRPREDDRPSDFEGKILVPFPVESSLSGVGRRVSPKERLWYRRHFTIPEGWDGKRVRLHFGAVDWECELRIDGRRVFVHEGGYDGFSVELDAAQATPGEHELVVAVWDPSDAGTQPRGKQVNRPHGIWYTPTSGIWQTVWLEALPTNAIEELQVTTDPDRGRIHVEVQRSRENAGVEIEVRASLNGTLVSVARGAGSRQTLSIAEPQLWSPDRPTLYDLEVRLLRGDQVLDEVKSYTGIRKISVERDAKGILRMHLNGEPLFQYGLLDQGFWPDGLYTPPSDEAMRYDLEVSKRLGFNLVRKHVKVECERWYSWCDRLGLLVWQDMPNGGPHIGPRDDDAKRSASDARNFERELRRLIAGRRHSPSIVLWVLFNEGWGQYETKRMERYIRSLDPTRLVTETSGWADRGGGQVYDIHTYPGPSMPKAQKERALVIGEFGGLGLPLKGHTWQDEKNWGYRSYTSTESYRDAYLGLLRRLRTLVGEGLSAAIYTQTTDVEVEVNGVMSYDREIIKLDEKSAARAAANLHRPAPRIERLLSDARQEPSTWRYRMEKPEGAWTAFAYDDAKWQSGPGGFGTPITPGAVIGTPWESSDIWLRRTFELKELPKGGTLALEIHHDEDAEVFLNGTLIAKLPSYSTGYELVFLKPEHRELLRKGTNRLAIHCRQTRGGQYIDAGFVRLVERKR